MFEIILLSFIIMLASLAGVIFVWKSLGRFIERNLSFMVSLSAGVFLVVTYQLGKEVIYHSDNSLYGVFWIVIGVLLFYGLFRFIPNFHHHHDEKEECDHPHDKLDARRIIVGDGIHNIGDGVLLAASVMTSPVLGTITAISIFAHEFVQEISEFFVLRQAGFSIKKALGINFLISATILIGSIGSFFLLETFELLEIPLLGIATGSFFVVVVNDLIPHSIRHSKNKTQYAKHITWFIVGIAVMLLVNSSMSHSHEENDHDHEQYIHQEELNHDKEYEHSEDEHDEEIHQEEDHRNN